MDKIDSKKTTENIPFKLSDFTYQVLPAQDTSRFVKVNCLCKTNNKPVLFYVCYPEGFCNNENEYLLKAKEYVSIITKNHEIYVFCDAYFRGKAYRFVTPYNYGNYINVKFKIKKSKKAIKGSNGGGPKKSSKKHKIALVATSLVAVTGTALAVYFYLTRNKSGGVNYNNAVITFNAGEGYISGTKDHSKTLRVNKGTSWKDVKGDSPKATNEAGTFKYWTINSQPIADNYVFDNDITINADYNIYTFDVIISAGGGAFKDGKDDKIKKVKYGTTWKQLVDADPNLEIKETPEGTKFSTFKDKDNQDVTNKDYVFKSTGDKVNVTATYSLKDSTIVTFSAGAGTFNDKSRAFTCKFDKNVTWATAKEKVQGMDPKLDGHTHNKNYKIGTTVLTDDYVFNDSSAVVTADYTANTYNINANANGGIFEKTSKGTETLTVEYGKKWGEIIKDNNFVISTLPEHKKGLFKFKIDGTSSYLEDETIITKDLNITAEYIKEDQYVLTIDAMGGTFSGISAKSELVYKGELWSKYKPNTPISTYKTFSMWTIDGTTAIEDTHAINETEKIYAKYTDTEVTVTIDPNGGTFDGGSTEAKTEKVKAGSKWDDIASKYKITSYPKDQDKTFDVYRVETVTGTVATNYTFVTNTKIIASYKSKPSVNITLDANGGSFDDSTGAKTITAITGQTWGTIKSSLPENPGKDGYKFENWYLNKTSPSTPIEDIEVFKDSTTIFANYSLLDVTVTLKSGDYGTFSDGETTKTETVKYGSTWGKVNTYDSGTGKFKYGITETLPDAHKFISYTYTDSTSTDKFLDNKHIFTENITITANYIDTNNKTVIVDPNGGKFNDASHSTDVKVCQNLQFTFGAEWKDVKKVIETNYGSIDIYEAPSGYLKTGYKYKDSTGSLQELSDTTKINSSLLITATYTADTVAVTLNSGTGGSYTGGDTTKKITPNYDSYYEESSKPDVVKTGYEFAYYVIGNTSTVVDTNHKYTETETLNAKYFVTLTFDAGEGKLPGANTIKVMQGTTWKSIMNSFTPTAKSSDYSFTNYTINDTTEVVSEETKFDAPITLKANYSLNNPSDFANDSWDKFTQIVSKGFKQISENDHAKGGYYDEFKNNNNTFVGLERTIKINGVNQTVRVIGENVDTISGGTTKAALTFEFVNTITTSEYSLGEGYTEWSKSELRNKLQNDIYKLMPSELQNAEYGIKSIDKSTYNKTDEKIETSSDKLFVLSASEMGYSKFPDYDTEVKNEGSKYAYFDTTTPVIKKDSAYWIRSTDLLTNGFTWVIDEEGNLGIKNESTGLYEPRSNDLSCGVAPCFAI